MRRSWGLGASLILVLVFSGITRGQSLSLTQTFPDALTAYYNFAYNATTHDFSLTDHLFGTSPNQYTNSYTDLTPYNGGTALGMAQGGTFTMNVYISNSGVPLTASQLQSAGDSDSCSITGTPTSGPYSGHLIDFFDSNSLVADGNAGTKIATVLQFEFAGDQNGVMTIPGWEFGAILTSSGITSTVASGGTFESNLWTQNFSNSTSYSILGGNVFNLPEPSSAVLMIGSVFMFARRRRRLS